MIRTQASELTQSIRAKSRQRVFLWRKVPRLAFLANGKTGFSGQLQIAITEGFWQINESSISVDLLTGELVNSHSVLKRYGKAYTVPHLASDASVLLVVGSQLDLIDARVLVAKLEREARQKFQSYMDRSEVMRWRRDTWKRLRAVTEMKRNYVSYARGQAIHNQNIREAVKKGKLVPFEGSNGCMGVHIRL